MVAIVMMVFAMSAAPALAFPTAATATTTPEKERALPFFLESAPVSNRDRWRGGTEGVAEKTSGPAGRSDLPAPGALGMIEARQHTEPGLLSFQCIVCAEACAALVDELDREVPSCKSCGSTARWRSMIHVLSMELFGENLALPDMDINRNITGIGMTDWAGYAVPLAEKFNYRNTYYNREPKLDITNTDPELHGTLDFIISSDVFEHVAPPVSAAFDNLSNLLKPGGVAIFSVPYGKGDKSVEHFPELYDYKIIEKEGRSVLENVTRNGTLQTFENLRWHGATLEMRWFSESPLIKEFRRAGLGNVTIYNTPDFRHGIYWKHWESQCNLPMSARKPKA